MNEETHNPGAGTPTPHVGDAAERAAIDRSCRVPVLFFFGSALFWLLVGTFFAIVTSIKLHDAEFMTRAPLPDAVKFQTGEFLKANPLSMQDVGFLTFGRFRAAHLNSVAYGWASSAAIGVGVWLMARLCRVPLRRPALVTGAGVLWNIGIAVGIAAILAGQSTSVEWLEFPPYAAIILGIAYAIIAVWAVEMFAARQPGHVYVTLWYVLAAFFWFPWLYASANILILLKPVQGSVQAIVNWWFGHNVLGLWFTPIGIGAAYYMIPKVIGRPIHSYYLSAIGFWSLALFYSWNGGHHLIGGPLPAWVITASIVASVMMVIPVVVTAINHHMTTKAHFHMLRYSPTLRFVVFGAMSYTLVSLQGSSMAIRSLNEITHFTHYTIGHAHFGLYAFFTMIMFGSMYYIVPRLCGCEWRSAYLIRLHFWTAAYGIVAMVAALTIGGLVQGLMLADPAKDFLGEILAITKPYLVGRSLSGVLLSVGHVVFAYHFALMVLQLGRREGGPVYFNPVPGEVRP